MFLLFFELVQDVFLDGLLIRPADGFSVVTRGPELPSPEVFLLDIWELSEEFSRGDAFEDIHALGDGDGGRKGDECVDVVGGHFDLPDLHVVIVGGFDEDLLENGALRLLENRMTVFGRPDQMVFEPRDVVLSVLQVHAVASLAPAGLRYPSVGQAPAVSAALAKVEVASIKPKQEDIAMKNYA